MSKIELLAWCKRWSRRFRNTRSRQLGIIKGATVSRTEAPENVWHLKNEALGICPGVESGGTFYGSYSEFKNLESRSRLCTSANNDFKKPTFANRTPFFKRSRISPCPRQIAVQWERAFSNKLLPKTFRRCFPSPFATFLRCVTDLIARARQQHYSVSAFSVTQSNFLQYDIYVRLPLSGYVYAFCNRGGNIALESGHGIQR